MSDAELIQRKFWKDFEIYSNESDINFDLSKDFGKGRYSYRISTGFQPSFFTVRTNDTDKEMTCKIRFRKGSKKANRFFNFLDLEDIEAKLNKGSQFLSGDNDKFSGKFSLKNKEKQHHTINWMLPAKELFDGNNHEEYCEWLDNNARLFRTVFRKYYRKFQDSQS